MGGKNGTFQVSRGGWKWTERFPNALFYSEAHTKCVCPPSTNTLYELSLSRWSNSTWRTRSYSTGCERQSCSFSQIPTNTAAEKPLLFSGNSFETWQKLLARPPWRVSIRFFTTLSTQFFFSYISGLEILSLLQWLERAAVKSPGK